MSGVTHPEVPKFEQRPSLLIIRKNKTRKEKEPEEREKEERQTDSRAIETLQEFHTILEKCFQHVLKKEGKEISNKSEDEEWSKLSDEVVLELAGKVSMEGWVFQEVDFSLEPKDRWLSYNFSGASFWGCIFPDGVSASSLSARGATVFDNHPSLPFRPARAFMYTQEELLAVDDEIYEFYKTKTSLGDRIAQSLHDFSIADAMDDYVDGRTAVGIMGGHSLWRHGKDYHNIVWLCREIARLGFIVCTGGGPGAMEAANLGAYLYQNTDDEVREALEIIGRDKDESGANYIIPTALAVLERFGFPTHQPSLGIPTYYYGHEPTNKFATFQAKYFSNALREADLLKICRGGIIFTRGAAGTRQEIFQYACSNHYAKPGEATPMIFFGKNWWHAEGVYQLVQKTAEGKDYQKLLLCTDTVDETVKHLHNHAVDKNLKLLTPEELKEPFWVADDLKEAYIAREKKQKEKENGEHIGFFIKNEK
eukprot:CAMPEP_0201523838 /NCGR_PEP_ID=MMETSP0161_2-20130828/20955_1 /ASSEMBLY_ACC=CAM_ASM_000251 /TAXON_ID=180227 /ORGANISM="Neoparamoeba aestuarina, Strain SoJaBio B1-5/56/2" /LENGTH=479 /DNA_ID=CAMNT_0047923063 /DNA_START=108 /DNA_END=1547 /DNA_ORIENTATION=-